MIFNAKDWTTTFNKKPYRGELKNGIPNGWGVMAVESDKCGEPTMVHVGHFVNGALEGRGYRLYQITTSRTIFRKPTYEEVMSTAEFDSCGRPIHYDGSMRKEVIYDTEWRLDYDGIWKEDRYLKPLRRDFSAWKDAKLEWEWWEDFAGSCTRTSSEIYKIHKTLSNGVAESCFMHLRITPLDDEQMLVQDSMELFVLRRGEEHTFKSEPNKTHYNYYKYKLL